MFIYNPFAKKNKRIKDPRKLGLFHWEKNQPKRIQTAEEVAAMFKALGAKVTKRKKDDTRRTDSPD